MSSEITRLSYLLRQFLNDSCTLVEQAELWQELAMLDNEELVKKELQHLWLEAGEVSQKNGKPDWDNMLQRVYREADEWEKGQPVIVAMWKRWLSAAAIIVVFGIGAYLWKTQKEKPAIVKTEQPAPVKNDVAAPMATHAIITLGNGKQIILDSAGKGTLAMQGEIKLTRQKDGKIAYTGNSEEAVYNTLTNPRGSAVISLILADGSQVWLNAESSLRYPTAFAGTERKVEVTGEAYFEVAHNAKMPFTVTKGNVAVKVLGTHFNVNAYNDEENIRITLLEGSVNVSKENTYRLLKPLQQAEINNGDNIRVVNRVDIDEVMAWKNGEFQFGDKADIKTIMRQIGRWYNVEVHYQGSVNGQIGGSISRKVNVSQVLNMLEKTGEVKFKIEGNKINVLP